jgi:hypothetical protein
MRKLSVALLLLCLPALASASSLWDVKSRLSFGAKADVVAMNPNVSAFCAEPYVSYTTTSQTSLAASWVKPIGGQDWSLFKAGLNLSLYGYEPGARTQIGVSVSGVYPMDADSLFAKTGDRKWTYEVGLKGSLGLIQNAAKRNVVYFAPQVAFDAQNKRFTYAAALNVPFYRGGK